MKSWFTPTLPRSIVGSSLARRLKAALPGAFRARTPSLFGAAAGRLDPLRRGWALRTLALMLVGFAATGVGLRAQNVSTFVGSGSGLDGPKGLAFDSSGNLYIANANANTVSKVTPGGVFTTFVPWYLSNPYGLAFDLSGTNLYVANKVTGLVSQVTPPGALSTFAEGFAIPTGLAFDTSGNLYVANQSLGTVSKVTPGGVVSPAPFVTLELDSLQGLAFDASGNLYVADYDTNTVIKVTTAGDKLAFASGFHNPTGLAFDSSGNLYVANSGANPGEGTVSKVTTGGVVTTFASGFSYPWGLAFDTAGDLYVANSGAKTVSKIVFTPIVISPTSASVASTAATLGGNVTSDAGLTITARGVVYSVTATNGNPQIGGSGVANVIGTGTTGVFTVSATGLTAGTGYSYAAYATNSRGTTYSPVGTFTTLPLPTVSSVSPSAGPTAGGTSVVITGTNFTNVTAVKFGTAAATGYTVNSATQITATSPSASAGTVHITVTTVSGTSATSAAAEFTFVAPNSAPTDISLSPSSVNENVATNTIVGALSTTDPDAGNTFTYTLVAGIGSADNASFNIAGSNLRITGSPNYEAKSSYAIRLRSTDQGSLWHEKAFTITINDVNESPTDISLSPSSVNENVATNTVVGALSTTDPDAGNTFTYTLVAGTGSADNASFNIDGSNLRITGSPDYEAKSSYAIRLRSTDQGSLWHEKAFTITINDVNESPTMTTVSALAGGAEDTPFTVTYDQLLAAANAADPEGATLSFRVEAVSTGTLTKNGTSVTAGATLLGTGESLVWTPAPHAYGALNAFTVRVWDGSLASATAVQVSVTVAPVAETPSVTHATTVEDEQTGSGLVITTNAPDGAEVTHFKLTAITNGRLYQTDGTTEITDGSFITIAEGGAGLKFTPALNKNTAAGDSFTFAVQAATSAAGGGLSPAATATITVTSVNDAPTDIALSADSIRRSAAANTTIGTLSTTDVDTGDTFTYTLVSGTGDTDNASFNLSGATLRATNPQALIGGARSVRVRSTDAGGLSFEKVLSITVVDDLLVVGSNADSGPGSLRQMIADLPVGGVISFALPSGSETIAVASYLLVDKSLTIDGRNTAGSGTPVTVQVTTPGASPWQVLSIELTDDDTVTLQNLVLRGGNVSGNAVPYGGVVLSEGGTLNLTDVTVRDGVAVAGGGLLSGSRTRAIRCTFTGNAAGGTMGLGVGGGVYAAVEPLLLMNCTIVGNTCQTGTGVSRGGGVYVDGPVSIINSTITGNTVSGAAPAQEGGGVYNQSGPLHVLNSIVAGNQAAIGADITTAAAGVTNCYYSWFAEASGATIGTEEHAPNQPTIYVAGQLSALGNYGGTSQTVRVNAGAPAIGHGTFVYDAGGYWFLATDGRYHRLDAYATTVADEPTGMIGTDQRGIARTSPPTIGAYQVGLNVAGTITRAGGVAFSGVTVRDGTRTVTTDASGSFALRDVPPGTYTLTPSYPGYTFTPASRSVTVTGADISGADFVAAPVPVTKDSQTITFAAPADVTLGQTVSLSASASSRLPVSFSVVSGPATVSGSTLTTTGVGLVTVRATQAGNGSYNAATPVERSFRVTVGAPPVVDTPTSVPAPAPGGAATLTVPQINPNLSYQWQRNGETLAGVTGATLTLTNVQPPAAGLYTYTATTAAGAGGTSEPVIVGVATTEKVEGTGTQVGADIQHPNGNIYDQLLLEGAGATFTAEPAQVTRMSYVDLSGDIVQVEFSGAGSLSLVMDDAGTPAPAANYNQPGVNYVRGHVGIVITGADETTNVAVFSVGRITAVNQTLFREEVAYDGVANIAFIAIQSTNGQFGGVRTGNVEYYASSGFTGLYAPGVAFAGPVNIGDIQAFDNAQPLLVVGSAPNARIAGGSLAQPNGQPVTVNGLTQLTMAPGQTSQGDALPAQTNQGVLEQDGVDVTDLLVTAP